MRDAFLLSIIPTILKQRTCLISRTLIALLFLLIPSFLWAQTEGQQGSTNLQIKQVRFTGNEAISSSLLETITRTRTNREFLGIPGFTPWYWLWKLNSNIGEAPYYLNHLTVGEDIERIKTYYESQGYFNTQVDTSIIEFSKGEVEVSFLINEGSSSYLRTMIYSGLPDTFGRKKRKQFFNESELLREKINDTTFSVERNFTFEKVSSERDRIVNFLKNNGYASVVKDSIKFFLKRDTTDLRILDALINIRHGRQYTFGDTFISLSGPTEYGDFDQGDTLRYNNSDKDSTYFIHIQKSSASQTNSSLLAEQLSYKGGDLFSNRDYLNSLRNFQNVGIFNIRRYALSESGARPNFEADTTLPVLFDLQAVSKHNIKLNLFGFQRYGYGTGLGLTYQNRNLFRNAERLEVGLNGSFEYAEFGGNSQLLSSRDATISYSEPRLNFPLGRLNDVAFFENSRTNYQIRYSQVNQINFDINANVGFNLQYEVNHTPTVSSSLNLLDIEWLDVEASQRFIDEVNDRDNLTELQKAFILDDFTPKINSVLAYTYRDVNTDVIQHNRGYYFESVLEFGGNLPYLVDNYANTSNAVDGSIQLFGGSTLGYSQYVKLSLDYRKYTSLQDNMVIAWRGFAGWAIPYGISNNVPLTRRFFAGGSNDIRGWAPGILGPGPSQTLQSSVTNGGEIKLAAFAEIRQELSPAFLSTRWVLAYFADAGNIWNGPQTPIGQGRFNASTFYKEIAVSSGIGIRLDWEYLILRIDSAFRLHEPTSENWFTNGNLYWSFGIGHSF